MGTGSGIVAVDDQMVWTLAVPGGRVWDVAKRGDLEATYYVAQPASVLALVNVAESKSSVAPDTLPSFRAAVSMLAGEAVEVVSIVGTGGLPPQMTIAVRSGQGHSFDLSIVVFGETERDWPPSTRPAANSGRSAVEAVLGPLRSATS
jgi:hypothetical protein